MTSAIRSRQRRATVVAGVICLLAGCDDRQRVVVAVADAQDLREGAPVTYVGVRIGEVEQIELGRTAVLLTLEVDASAPLRTEDSVVVGVQGLIGDREVRILPGPDGASAVSARDTLRNTRVERRIDTGRLVEALGKTADSVPE